MSNIIFELSNAEYHAISAIGSSGLKLLKRSPKHYWAANIDTNRKPREQTAGQLLGSAVHMAILEPHLFNDTYALMTDGLDRRTSEGKKAYAEIMQSGLMPLSQDLYEKILAMANSAHLLSFTKMIKNHALAEVSIFWCDKETGVYCKVRPDWHVPPNILPAYPNGLIIDAKTCADASVNGFAKNAWSSDMHIQSAFYSEGFQQAYETENPPVFMWLGIEGESPFASKYHECPTFLIDYGMEQVRELLEIYAICSKNDDWPCYDDSVSMLELPAYALREIEGNNEEVSVSYV